MQTEQTAIISTPVDHFLRMQELTDHLQKNMLNYSLIVSVYEMCMLHFANVNFIIVDVLKWYFMHNML